MADFILGPKALARGYRLLSFDITPSTSSEAARAASAGDHGPAWFVTQNQTAGRGRRGRAWVAPSGNLAASLLLVPACDPSVAATLGFVAGLALCGALGDAGARVMLKWPNDVLIEGRKLAGILLEAHSLPDGRQAIVIGCGVNIVAAPTGFPYPATALHEHSVAASAAGVFASFAEHWVDAYALWRDGAGVADILARWRRVAHGIGGEISVSDTNGTRNGIFETIDDAGRLLLRLGDGSRVAIAAGDVYFGETTSARA